jgi:hypothetical protein
LDKVMEMWTVEMRGHLLDKGWTRFSIFWTRAFFHQTPCPTLSTQFPQNQTPCPTLSKKTDSGKQAIKTMSNQPNAFGQAIRSMQKKSKMAENGRFLHHFCDDLCKTLVQALSKSYQDDEMAENKAFRRIWVITTMSKVKPVEDLKPDEVSKFWCREGDDRWQPGTPPGTSATVNKKPKQATDPPGRAGGAGLFNLIGGVK